MTLQEVRDWAIILLSVLSVGVVVFLLLAALRLYRKVAPLLDALGRTLGNIQGTTEFVAETTVHPIIRVLGFIAGVRAAGGAFGKFVKRKGGGP